MRAIGFNLRLYGSTPIDTIDDERRKSITDAQKFNQVAPSEIRLCFDLFDKLKGSIVESTQRCLEDYFRIEIC